MTKKILCLGDSNTYGYDPRAIFGSEYDRPWPLVLSKLTGWDVINMGENGRKIPISPVFISWIDKQIRRSLPADLLIIMLGTNDIDDAVRNYHLAGERMDQYLAHLKAEFPKLPILLLIPVNVEYTMQAKEISRIMREDYKKLAPKYRIRCMDTNEWGLELTFDGVHLTEESHVMLAGKLAEILV